MRKLTSLGELAQELNVYKSKLQYYTKLGLLKPVRTVSRKQIYDKEDTIERLDKIRKGQKQGKTLREIKMILNNK